LEIEDLSYSLRVPVTYVPRYVGNYASKQQFKGEKDLKDED